MPNWKIGCPDARKSSKKSNEELEAFSYSVSHDLRAPLRGIIGFTNILEEDYTGQLDEEAKRITATIKNNTTRMGILIDDLLAFSRMGRQQLEKTSIDTDEMVQQVIEDQERLAGKSNPVFGLCTRCHPCRQMQAP